MEAARAAAALEEAGFTPRAALFVALVVLAGGVFVRGFAARWIGDGDGRRGRTDRFLDTDVSAAWARAFRRDKGLVHERTHSSVVYHFRGKGLYRAVGAENSRYRRQLELEDWPRVVGRVLKAWAALSAPAWPWVFSVDAQLAVSDSLGVPRSVLPTRVYGVGKQQASYFPDRPLMALAGDRLVLVRPYVEDDLVDNTSSLRTWWRHYSPFVEAVGGAGVQVSLRLVRPAGAPNDPGVDELLALWEAEGSAVEAVRDIWFGRQEVLRLEGGHPRVVEAYGGAEGVAERIGTLEARMAERRGEVVRGVADSEIWQAEELPSSW